MQKFQVLAEILLLSEVDQPKHGGVRNGYVPHHKFEGVDYLVSGFHHYGDDALHFPGEIISAKISFPSWEHFGDDVSVGDRFEIREMDRLVGSGIIKRIEE